MRPVVQRFIVPELPEVETVVRELRPGLLGQELTGVRRSRLALRTKWQPAWNRLLAGRVVNAVERRGKWIVVRLDDDSRLVVHLGMTGQLRVVETAVAREPHTHLIVGLNGGNSELRFRDVRRFGSATVFRSGTELANFFLASELGPEPFTLSPPYWRERLSGARRSLKAILLDQRVVAGVGNIYADESLFESRLPPWQWGSATSPGEADRLRKALATVLSRAIERRGSSIRDYIGASGRRGDYQNEFRVYGRTGQPCRRCRTAVVRVRLAGRSTHYCPRCQAPSVKSSVAVKPPRG
jgi:formamidopyrimidine-DNA glycosylase